MSSYNAKNTSPATAAEIDDALSYVSADGDRYSWIRILGAIKHELGADGEDIARNWSQSSEQYDERGFNSAWKSIRSHTKPATALTIFREALDGGWKPLPKGDHVFKPSREKIIYSQWFVLHAASDYRKGIAVDPAELDTLRGCIEIVREHSTSQAVERAVSEIGAIADALTTDALASACVDQSQPIPKSIIDSHKQALRVLAGAPPKEPPLSAEQADKARTAFMAQRNGTVAQHVSSVIGDALKSLFEGC